MGPLDQILALMEACPPPRPLSMLRSNIPHPIKTVETDNVTSKEASNGLDTSKRTDVTSEISKTNQRCSKSFPSRMYVKWMHFYQTWKTYLVQNPVNFQPGVLWKLFFSPFNQNYQGGPRSWRGRKASDGQEEKKKQEAKTSYTWGEISTSGEMFSSTETSPSAETHTHAAGISTPAEVLNSAEISTYARIPISTEIHIPPAEIPHDAEIPTSWKSPPKTNW